MKDDERRWRYEDPSNRDDLWIAVLTLILFGISFYLSGCTLIKTHPEPQWAPDAYLYSPIESRCVFINGEGHKIDCDEPMIHDMVLIPLSDLKSAMEKFQRCVEWQ